MFVALGGWPIKLCELRGLERRCRFEFSMGPPPALTATGEVLCLCRDCIARECCRLPAAVEPIIIDWPARSFKLKIESVTGGGGWIEVAGCLLLLFWWIAAEVVKWCVDAEENCWVLIELLATDAGIEPETEHVVFVSADPGTPAGFAARVKERSLLVLHEIKLFTDVDDMVGEQVSTPDGSVFTPSLPVAEGVRESGLLLPSISVGQSASSEQLDIGESGIISSQPSKSFPWIFMCFLSDDGWV